MVVTTVLSEGYWAEYYWSNMIGPIQNVARAQCSEAAAGKHNIDRISLRKIVLRRAMINQIFIP